MVGGSTITPPAGVHALLPIDNPVYGRRIIGISSQYQFFQIWLGGPTGADAPANYDPYRATNPDAAHAVPAARVTNFTAEPDLSAVDSDGDPIPVRLITDGRRVLVVLKRQVLTYDMATNSFLQQILAPTPDNQAADLPDQDWTASAWVDGYFILGARNGQIFHSVLNEINFDQLDTAMAGAKPDGIVGMRVLNRRLFIFGTESIEQWYNAGASDFAFRRDNSQVMELGCIAPHSIAVNIAAIIFVGHDLMVYAVGGAQFVRISTDAVDYDIAQSQAEKARGFVYTEEGHRFYSLTLFFDDGSRKNWTFDFNTRAWHERTGHHTRILCATRLGEQNLVGLEGDPWIYDTRLDWGISGLDVDGTGGSAFDREAVSPLLHANLQRARVNTILLDLPDREGDPNDTLSLSWSDDGQKTFTDDDARRLPMEGRTRFRWNRLGQFTSSRHFRLRTSARRRVDILGAYAETEVGPD